MRQRVPVSIVPLLCVSVTAACSVQRSDIDAQSSIEGVVQSLEDAANARDWDAFFSHFSADADLVVFDSPRAQGRLAAQALMEAGWESTPADVRGDLTVASVRVVSPGVAIAEISAEFTGSSPSRDRATAVVVHRDAGWQVDAFRIFQPEAGSEIAAADLSTPEGKIRNALSAAPTLISANAAVWDWPANDGDDPTVLREGTNGWTCFPSEADFDADAPLCMDEAYLGVEMAQRRGEPARLESVGLRYMLRGGPTLDEQGRRVIGPHLMAAVPLGEDAVASVGQDLRPRGPYVFAREGFSVLVVPMNP